MITTHHLADHCPADYPTDRQLPRTGRIVPGAHLMKEDLLGRDHLIIIHTVTVTGAGLHPQLDRPGD